MRQAKRDKLTTVDINNALKLRNVEVRGEKTGLKATSTLLFSSGLTIACDSPSDQVLSFPILSYVR